MRSYLVNIFDKYLHFIKNSKKKGSISTPNFYKTMKNFVYF